METNVSYTIVGAFVLSLMTATVLAIVWLSSGFSAARYLTYAVKMQESVSGLNTDSQVEFNGVIVGSIESIELNQKDPKIVDLLLKVKEGTPITHGTVATLTTRGITGAVFMALKDTGKDSRPLIATNDQPYPVIPTAPSIFVRLDIALTQINTSFKQLSESIRGLLNKENLEAIRISLQNIRVGSAELNSLLKSSSITVKGFQAQTLPSTNQLINNLNDVSTELKQNPAILIRGRAPAKLGPGEQ